MKSPSVWHIPLVPRTGRIAHGWCGCGAFVLDSRCGINAGAFPSCKNDGSRYLLLRIPLQPISWHPRARHCFCFPAVFHIPPAPLSEHLIHRSCSPPTERSTTTRNFFRPRRRYDVSLSSIVNLVISVVDVDAVHAVGGDRQ